MKHTEESEFDREFRSYESMDMMEADKREVFSRLMNSVELPQKKRLFRDVFNPVVSAILAAAFLMVGGYFVANQILQEDPVQQSSPAAYEGVEKQLSDTFNKEVIIPNHPKYHAQMIWVPYSGSSMGGGTYERDRPLGATIIYKAESNTLDNKDLEKLREMGDFVYGKPVINPFKDIHSEIRVDISNVNAISGEEIDIEGTRVYYKEIEMDTDRYIKYNFLLNHLTYSFSHKVTGPETPTEARAFVTSFLKQVNK